MKYIRILKILFLLAITGFLTHGCATILGGKSNTLVFSGDSIPVAQVFIDGELIGKAPGKIKVPKGKIQHGSILVIKAEGYSDKEYLILRKQNAAYSVIDLLIGGIPLAVDYTTGNIYRPVPRTFKYELVKNEN